MIRRSLLLLALAATASAQPASLALDRVASDALALPALDNDALARQHDEAARRAGPAPLRFAEPVPVSVDPEIRPGWSLAPDGTRIWRLAVSSPGAYSLGFGFTRFRVPEGATLWIYPEGRAPEYRPFTAADNEVHGELWTPIVPGDRAIIELNLPPSSQPTPFDLELGQVTHAFRPVLLTEAEKDEAGARRSGSCNVDVVCPQGAPYGDIIRSVGAYTVGGIDFCSGAAINNTADDSRALFLTADHCGINSSNSPQVVVYWNYQNSTCRTPGSGASGANGDGSRSQFNSGTVELGDGSSSDWSILEFDDPILEAANVYLAGWDRRDLAPTSAIAIHHPSVEEKRISFENDPTSITSYLSNNPQASGTHIRIADWDLGTTEGGSSGSPLFNTDRRIVGQLHGGFASCTSQTPDWYGRMFRSMNDGLAAILDPSGTGAQTLDGREAEAPPPPPGTVTVAATASSATVEAGDTVSFAFEVANGTTTDYADALFVNDLPSGLTFDGALDASIGTASVEDGVVSWTGTLAAGTLLVISYDAAVDDGVTGQIDNVALFDLGTGGAPLLASASVSVVWVRPDADVVVEATPGVVIPDRGCTTSELVVADNLDLERVSVGVVITHPFRGDLSLTLTSASGTTVDLLSRVGTGGFGSSADNLDILIDDAAPADAFASGDHDAGAPYYETGGAPEAGAAGAAVGALAAFVGEQSAGTWTLEACDSGRANTGSLDRWSLFLSGDDAGPGSTSAEGDPEARRLQVSLVGPNPAHGDTSVRITVDGGQPVRAVLVDATGRIARVVLDADLAGTATEAVRLDGLSAGTYFLQVQAGADRQTLPITVLR